MNDLRALRDELDACRRQLHDERSLHSSNLETYKRATACNLQVANQRADEAAAALLAAQARIESAERRLAEMERVNAQCVEDLRNAELDEHEGDWRERAERCLRLLDAAIDEARKHAQEGSRG